MLVFYHFLEKVTVYVPTENEQGEQNNNQFTLVVALSNTTVFGILCEKGK